MKTINVCLLMANYVKFFVATSPILFLNFKFQVYPKVFQTWLTDITDPVLAATNMFQDHPSIKNIKARKFKSVFSFTHTSEIEIKKNIRGMNVHETCHLKYIPTKIIMPTFLVIFCLHFNYCMDIGQFTQEF